MDCDCLLPDFSFCGVSQARILEWVATYLFLVLLLYNFVLVSAIQHCKQS